MGEETTLLTGKTDTDAGSSDDSTDQDLDTGSKTTDQDKGDDGKGGADQDADKGKGDKGDKGDGEKGDKGKGGKSDDYKSSDGAPESYSDFSMPEGIDINETDLGAFHELAKNMNLTQDQAQGLVDYQSKRAEGALQSQQEAFTDQQEGWIKELKADKDFGGDSFDENSALAAKVVRKFGNPEVTSMLMKTGMGNNPLLVKMFNSIGKAISEDNLQIDGDKNNGPVKKNAENILYPNQK